MPAKQAFSSKYIKRYVESYAYNHKVRLFFIPVVNILKFSAVFGTVSLKSSKNTVPAGTPSMVISKKTIGRRSISALVGANVDFRLGGFFFKSIFTGFLIVVGFF